MLNKQNVRGGVEVYSDSEALTYDSNFTAYNGANNRFIKTGNVVQMCCVFSNIDAIASNATATMANIKKVGLRPKNQFNFLMQASARAFYLVTVYTNGNITLARHRDNDGYVQVGERAWLNCNATYIAQDE